MAKAKREKRTKEQSPDPADAGEAAPLSSTSSPKLLRRVQKAAKRVTEAAARLDEATAQLEKALAGEKKAKAKAIVSDDGSLPTPPRVP